MKAIDHKLLAVFALLVIAVISDLRTYRIRNTITIGFMFTGLVSNLMTAGIKGVFFSVQGLLLPVICLLLLYMMRAMGAGDIKLLSAIGAFMGSGFVINAIIFALLSGGLMAFILILARRNGPARIKQLLIYAKSCILTTRLLEYSDMKERSDGSKFHFSPAIAAGTIMAATIGNLGIALF